MTVQGYLTTASSTWATLTPAEMAAWDDYGKLHPRTDSLGQTYRMTGQQAFISNAFNRLNMGALLSTTPPTVTTVFRALPFTFTITPFLNLNVTPAGNGGLTDGLLISMGPPTSAGRRAWFQWEQVGEVAGNDASTTDWFGNYSIFFPTPLSGQRVFCRVIPVSAHGIRGVPLMTFADVP
jgi:hypothetical protein